MNNSNIRNTTLRECPDKEMCKTTIINNIFVPLISFLNVVEFTLVIGCIRRIKIREIYETLPPFEVWCMFLLVFNIFECFTECTNIPLKFDLLDSTIVLSIVRQAVFRSEMWLTMNNSFLILVKIRFYLTLQQTAVDAYLSETVMNLFTLGLLALCGLLLTIAGVEYKIENCLMNKTLFFILLTDKNKVSLFTFPNYTIGMFLSAGLILLIMIYQIQIKNYADYHDNQLQDKRLTVNSLKELFSNFGSAYLKPKFSKKNNHKSTKLSKPEDKCSLIKIYSFKLEEDFFYLLCKIWLCNLCLFIINFSTHFFQNFSTAYQILMIFRQLSFTAMGFFIILQPDIKSKIISVFFFKCCYNNVSNIITITEEHSERQKQKYSFDLYSTESEEFESSDDQRLGESILKHTSSYIGATINDMNRERNEVKLEAHKPKAYIKVLNTVGFKNIIVYSSAEMKS